MHCERQFLPPADHALSPRTGWTRAHWEAMADHLLDALEPYATPGRAQYRLPGRTSSSGELSDGLEGFARSFLLAAFRVAGSGAEPGSGSEPGGGRAGHGDTPVERFAERYAAGLAAGTDPASGEAWPAITDRSQQMVEAASIAVALSESRPWIWDRLDGGVRERIVDWLGGFAGRSTHDNNWRLFKVVATQFLASVGAPHARADIEDGLDRVEDWYRGDGWYSDGDGRNFDYYIGWAMHFYPLLWSRMAGGDDGGRTAVYQARLRQFLTTYPHFFGGDGAPVHQGRSLTYRFAAVAPVWMGALADCSPLAPGLTRRLASGAVRHFTEHGVPDGRGLLTLGWYGPHLPTTQAYSGPASPYWASKGFLGLLLPPGHPVWTERELSLPVEESDQYTALPAPGWLLHGTRSDGIVRLVNHGSDHWRPGGEHGTHGDDPHYAKLAYSSATAPESAPHAWAHTVDSHIALVSPAGIPSRRARVHPLTCAGRTASSRHAAALPGDARAHGIETTSLVHGPYEIRVHRVDAPPGAGVREGGYAVAGDEPPQAEPGAGWALARTADGLVSAVVGLHGWANSGVHHEARANAFGPHSATPYLTFPDHPGGRTVHVTLVALTRDGVDPRALRDAAAVTVTGDHVTVELPGLPPAPGSAPGGPSGGTAHGAPGGPSDGAPGSPPGDASGGTPGNASGGTPARTYEFPGSSPSGGPVLLS
ncbi:DUF2264 domain-containing protein [Streptomyces varsoviensis]|uniref:DUF2264 domain-containing protein n=1 Tax=Streptomyces varsoviensis TaxID=67373 RepID=UPI001FE13299|nr:DUF2264 domain-containing protein [Streptomyces varsoviensis]